MNRLEVYIEGVHEPFITEIKDKSKEEIDKEIDNFISEVGIGDGSLRTFWTNTSLNFTAPDLYIINADGNIHGEGYIE